MTAEDWLAQLGDNRNVRPEDWETLLIAADWFDDQGDHEVAAGLRWAGEHQKRPWAFDDPYHARWLWLDQGPHYDSMARDWPACRLPEPLFRQVEKAVPYRRSQSSWGYLRLDSLADAMRFLGRGLEALRACANQEVKT
jgi:hypothetical protein